MWRTRNMLLLVSFISKKCCPSFLIFAPHEWMDSIISINNVCIIIILVSVFWIYPGKKPKYANSKHRLLKRPNQWLTLLLLKQNSICSTVKCDSGKYEAPLSCIYSRMIFLKHASHLSRVSNCWLKRSDQEVPQRFVLF